MLSARTLEIVLFACVLLGLASGCSTYRAVALGSLEVGDQVRVTDFQGGQYAFRVTHLDQGRITGDRIEFEVGQIAAVHRKGFSLFPIAKGFGKVVFGAFYLIYLVGSSIPVWAFAL